MVLGDGAIVRAGLDAILELLRNVAQPTGARASVLMMSGGLIVLGFLFLAFLFRSAIVGDLAPVANARAPTPRAALPPRADRVAPARSLPRGAFHAGRSIGRDATRLDAAFDLLRTQGVEARILQSNEHWKLVRLYRCLTCAHEANARGCEFERGLIAGAFEALTGDVVKVHETACRTAGFQHCEFEVRHAVLAEAR